MKPTGAIRYPVPGVTLHRVVGGQRSQGDGEEQQSTPKLRPPPTSHSAPNIPSSFPSEARVEEHGSDCCRTKADGNLKVATLTEVVERKDNVSRSKVPSECFLPEVSDIALQLTKVSIMTHPDADLLNAPPKDLPARTMVMLQPKTSTITPTKQVAASVCSKKKKDPRFVPYEPYKGCVKPILSHKLRKTRKKRLTRLAKRGIGAETTIAQQRQENDNTGDELLNLEKMSIVIKDFEEERSAWEKNTAQLQAEKKAMESQLSQMKKEKINMENQLSIQSQVNGELKKLLVASVGEDVQGRVQCLTEDKARMATMIRHYSEKVDRDYEEKERIGIQCDVWRSKFLGSSMLVDDLVSCKVEQTHKLEEAVQALRLLVEEHDLTRQHLLKIYRMNKQLRDAFDPLAAQSGGVLPLSSADLVTLAVDGDVLAETVRDRLLGDLGRSVGCSLSLDGLEHQTPGEKVALQLLSQSWSKGGSGCTECSTVSPGRPANMHRYHPNTRYEHLTVNCCSHCNGDIIVV